MIRSFLAIELPGVISKKIEEVQEDLKLSRADVRWVAPEKIHLTLKFFGNIEEARVDAVVKAIESPIHSAAPFPIGVRGMGAFPHLKNPRVIWMGLVDEREGLAPLQKQIEAELEKIGFETEKRAFKPHLTLGRVNSSRGKGELIERVEKRGVEAFGGFEVKTVILFKSDLKPSGPIYTSLREVKLGG